MARSLVKSELVYNFLIKESQFQVAASAAA